MPITPTQYAPRPYARGGSLGEILRLRGRDAAEAELRNGEIQARMWSDLGNTIGGSINSYAKERQEAPIRAQEARARTLGIEQAQGAIAAQKRTVSDQGALDQAVSAGEGGKLDPDAIEASLPGHLRLPFRKSWNDAESAAVTLREARSKAEQADLDYRGTLAVGVKPHLSDPDGGMGWALGAIQHAKQNGHPEADQWLAELQNNPAALPTVVDTWIQQSPTQRKFLGEESDRTLKEKTLTQATADREADNIRQAASAAETGRHNRAMEGRPVAGGTVTPLANLGPQHEPIVKALLDYRQPLPGGIAVTKGDWPALLEAAHTIDPTFDVSQYSVRQALKKSFSSGKDADNIRGLNTAVGHLGSLSTAMSAMGNGNWESVNAATNALAKHLPVTQGLVDRQGKIVNTRQDFNAVKGELAGIFKASGATDQEIKSWESTLSGDPASATPGEREAFVKGAVELMASRMGANRQKLEAGMGKPVNFVMLSPHSREILKGLGIDAEAIDPSGTAEPPPAPPPATQATGRVNPFRK